MIDWAGVIFVMERKHREMISKRFLTAGNALVELGIEDNYPFGDIELIGILKSSLSGYL
jgi:predicted protein tyrosine phosphatase